MRVPITNGNGYCCDRCGKPVRSEDIRIIQALMPSPDKKKQYTGGRQNIGKFDVCQECFNSDYAHLFYPGRPEKHNHKEAAV